jgi:hypothetical protein
MLKTPDSPRIRAPEAPGHGGPPRREINAGSGRFESTVPISPSWHRTHADKRGSAGQFTVSLIRLLIVVKGWAPQTSRFFSRRRWTSFFSEIAERSRTSCGFCWLRFGRERLACRIPFAGRIRPRDMDVGGDSVLHVPFCFISKGTDPLWALPAARVRRLGQGHTRFPLSRLLPNPFPVSPDCPPYPGLLPE